MLWSEKFHLIFIQELYASMQLLSHFKVSIHPSHSVMIPNLGEDEAEILGQVESHSLTFLQSACLNSFPSLLFMAWSRLKPLNWSCQPWLTRTMWNQEAWQRPSWLKRSSSLLTDSPYHLHHTIQGLGGFHCALPDHESWVPHPRRHGGSRRCCWGSEYSHKWCHKSRNVSP